MTAAPNTSASAIGAGTSSSSAEWRYNQNLKVLRRRDPSIVSIFDQFSYVCLYRHDEGKWQKIGYEGTMFLYERDSYPPYGFYILNRTGADDYSQGFCPEDDVSVSGQFFMIRNFPDYTASRRALVGYNPATSTSADKFDKKYIPPEEVTGKDKGRALTFGLWTFAGDDGKESMKDVLTKLYAYVKKNDPYPDHFKHSHWHGRPPSCAAPPPTSAVGLAGIGLMQQRPASSLSQRSDASTPDANNLQYTPELSRLLSKLMPATPEPESHPPYQPASSSYTKPRPPKMKNVSSVQTINPSPPQSQLQAVTLPSLPTSGSTGLALLDSIFASASAAPTPSDELELDFGAPSSHADPFDLGGSSSGSFHQTEQIIHSPKPTSTILPQILNQDVIASLMGLGMGSRASSVAPSTGSSAVHGDNEDGDSSDGSGRLSGSQAQSRTHHPGIANGFVNSAPHVATARSHPSSSSLVPPGSAQPHMPQITKRGDETPRNRSIDNRVQNDVPPVPQRGVHTIQQHSPPVSYIQGQQAGDAHGNAVHPRPFQSSWPSFSHTPVDDTEDDGDIIELDFADMGALAQTQESANTLSYLNGRTPVAKSTRLPQQQPPVPQQAVLEGQVIRNGVGHTETLTNGNGKKNRRREKPSRQNSISSTSASTSELASGDDIIALELKQALGLGVKPASADANNGLDREAAKAAILHTAGAGQKLRGRSMERNEFVRELLTLIHTDSKFVDGLWHEYHARI